MTSFPQHKFQQLYEMALDLASVRLQADSFQLIIDQAQNLTKAKYASLFLMEHGKLVRACSSDKILYQIAPRPKGVTRTAFDSNTSSLLHVNYIKKYQPRILKLGVASDINVPLEYDGVVMGVLSVLSPAERKFSQEDLELLKFYGPLAALAIKNANYLQQLQESLESRDLFISIAAHELKTPLTSLKLYTQHLQKRTQSQTISSSIKKITATLGRLSALVDELLKIDHVKRGTLHFKNLKCNLKNPVSQAIAEFTLAYPNRFVSYSYDLTTEPYIKGDSDKILQAVLNILTNAGKFSPPGKPILVLITDQGANWQIDINDRGEGIPDELQKSIFERFFKVIKRTPSAGMGLGLFLVKHIIERHGGEVSVTSKHETGTTFTLALPKYNVKNGN